MTSSATSDGWNRPPTSSIRGIAGTTSTVSEGAPGPEAGSIVIVASPETAASLIATVEPPGAGVASTVIVASPVPEVGSREGPRRETAALTSSIRILSTVPRIVPGTVLPVGTQPESTPQTLVTGSHDSPTSCSVGITLTSRVAETG